MKVVLKAPIIKNDSFSGSEGFYVDFPEISLKVSHESREALESLVEEALDMLLHGHNLYSPHFTERSGDTIYITIGDSFVVNYLRG